MTQAAQSFRDLVVWQRAHSVVLDVYKLTRTLPKEELFGLVSQMRRSAVSVPANIAEGFKRKGLPVNALADRLDEVARMLDSYIQKILASRS